MCDCGHTLHPLVRGPFHIFHGRTSPQAPCPLAWLARPSHRHLLEAPAARAHHLPPSHAATCSHACRQRRQQSSPNPPCARAHDSHGTGSRYRFSAPQHRAPGRRTSTEHAHVATVHAPALPRSLADAVVVGRWTSCGPHSASHPVRCRRKGCGRPDEASAAGLHASSPQLDCMRAGWTRQRVRAWSPSREVVQTWSSSAQTPETGPSASRICSGNPFSNVSTWVRWFPSSVT